MKLLSGTRKTRIRHVLHPHKGEHANFIVQPMSATGAAP